MDELLISIGGGVLALIVAIWVFFDAKSRGMNAIIWALFTFFLLIIGLPVYLLTRKDKLGGSA